MQQPAVSGGSAASAANHHYVQVYTSICVHIHIHTLYKGQQIVIVSPGMTRHLALGYGVARRRALLPLLNGFRKSKIK